MLLKKEEESTIILQVIPCGHLRSSLFYDTFIVLCKRGHDAFFKLQINQNSDCFFHRLKNVKRIQYNNDKNEWGPAKIDQQTRGLSVKRLHLPFSSAQAQHSVPPAKKMEENHLKCQNSVNKHLTKRRLYHLGGVWMCFFRVVIQYRPSPMYASKHQNGVNHLQPKQLLPKKKNYLHTLELN